MLKSRKLGVEISKNKTHIFLPIFDSMDFLKVRCIMWLGPMNVFLKRETCD